MIISLPVVQPELKHAMVQYNIRAKFKKKKNINMDSRVDLGEKLVKTFRKVKVVDEERL